MTSLGPIAMYSSDMWAVRKLEELSLMLYERDVLKKIYGPVYKNRTNEWRTLLHYELQLQFQNSNIIQISLKEDLCWWAVHSVNKDP